MSTSQVNQPATERQLTGRGFLAILAASFGFVFVINFYMIYMALSTFSGEVADHPYETGLKYNQEIAAAKAQKALGWNVTVATSPIIDGKAQLTVDARDAAGNPMTGLEVVAQLESPVDRARDSAPTRAALLDGLYRASLAARPGQWDLLIDARVPGGGARFQARDRVRLDAAP